MNKIHIAIGKDAEGKAHVLYAGQEGQTAKDTYTDAVNGKYPGIVWAGVALRIRFDRRHDVVVPAVSPVEVSTSPEVETETAPSDPAKSESEPVQETDTAVEPDVQSTEAEAVAVSSAPVIGGALSGGASKKKRSAK